MGEVNKRIYADIGAGWGERFVRRAQESPEQKFVVVEPERRNIPPRIPPNLTWIVGGVEKGYFLPLESGSVDEVNLDFVLFFVHGEVSEEVFPLRVSEFLDEMLRITKKGGKIFIREPRENVERIRPLLQQKKIIFSEKLMPEEEARSHSEAAREMLSGEKELQPFVIEIEK